MSGEDPYPGGKDEVLKAVARTRGLYQRWCELKDDPTAVPKEEIDWTLTELKNGLRSVEWDLEDLEETVLIVAKNQKKFKIDDAELNRRRQFIEATRTDVSIIKDRMSFSKNNNREKEKKTRQPLLSTSLQSNYPGYTRLQSDVESPSHTFTENTLQTQQNLVRQQDDQLDMIQDSMGTLKTMSRQIGNEVDEQLVMLDDLGQDIEQAESRLDTTMKKMAKVLHLSNDRRQWIVIGVLSTALLLLIILLLVL